MFTHTQKKSKEASMKAEEGKTKAKRNDANGWKLGSGGWGRANEFKRAQSGFEGE